MMKRYYLIIKFLPQNSDNALMCGRCISVLHGFLCHNNLNNIGVTFPLWQQDDIGGCIAFVSNNKSILIALKTQEIFRFMHQHQIIDISDICDVPENTKDVQFIRNQKIDKYFGGRKQALKRLEKRALSRGEKFSPNLKSEVVFEHYHSIPTESSSKKTTFKLYIQKCHCAVNPKSEYGNYGLATVNAHTGTVPDLSDYL